MMNRWFRLRHGMLKLVASHEVEKTAHGYQSTGETSWFELAPDGGAYPEGWCRLRFAADSEAGPLQPKLHFERSATDGNSVCMRPPLATGRTHSFLTRLPPRLIRMRMEPCCAGSRFECSDIRFVELGRVALAVYLAARFAARALRAPIEASRWMARTSSVVHRQGWGAVRKDLDKLTIERRDYAAWVERFDAGPGGEGARMRGVPSADASTPLISIVVPTFNTPPSILGDCIRSVLAQSYANWELCVADDASPDAEVRTTLEGFARRDPRIRLVFRESRGHISIASNSALELARGEFVGFLDHDDVLAPDALACFVEALDRHPCDIAYSDEDKIDARGQRFEAHFKPDWNPELFLASNYVCHFLLLRRSLLLDVGGLRPGFEGAQDYDLLLRATRLTDPTRILHIPHVLYHWRAIPGSTAIGSGEKSYAADAGLAALRDYLHDVEPKATVSPGPLPTSYRVQWPLPEPAPDVTIIVASTGRTDLLQRCVETLCRGTAYPSFEVVVVHPEFASAELRTLAGARAGPPAVRIIEHHGDFNLPAMVNLAAGSAHGEMLAIVRDDLEVIADGWLAEMVSQAARPGIGAVGAKLLGSDNTVRHAGLILGVRGVVGFSHQGIGRDELGINCRAVFAQSLSAVSADCMVVRRALFEQMGGFDSVALEAAYFDVDFCLRVRDAGMRNVFTPHAVLASQASRRDLPEASFDEQSRRRRAFMTMRVRWSAALAQDPAYNPNLTLEDSNFDLAWPPRVAHR
jgi:GT2 family glycosyltransferase